MSIRVIRPGLLTSLQDLGRYGLRQYGVVVSGAMDSLALRVANWLVGNAAGDAALEITLLGPTLLFEDEALIAICGGDLSPSIDGQPVPDWRPVWVEAGTRLQFGAASRGCRAYLAAAGGFDVPKVLGSRSTYLRGGLGGFQGRALQAGDVLQLQPAAERASRVRRRLANVAATRSFAASMWSANSIMTAYRYPPVVRTMPGGQFDWLTADSREQFFAAEFQMTPQSDRMGYRLAGPRLQLAESRELISEAVVAGTVQVPPEGQPIVLMADCPTTGGYAKIAQVATVDLPVVAQVKPGERIRFQEISLAEAQRLYRERETELRKLECGIALKDE